MRNNKPFNPVNNRNGALPPHFAELLRTEQRMRSIIKAAVDAIITIDDRGNIESANPATERLFGYRERELIGQNVSILMPEPYRSEHDRYLRQYLKTGTAKVIGIGREVTAVRKDGTTIPISLSVSEVETGGGRIFTGIIHDLTSRRNLERQIVEASANEQRRIGHDLHDGLCQDLIGIAFSADQIGRSLRAKGVQEEAVLADTVAASVRNAAAQARRLSHGLNPVDLKAGGLRAALDALSRRISDTFGVRCRFHSPSDENRIHDDTVATHLFRIAQEAVSNAIRHGRAKRIHVKLEIRLDHLVLTVKDDGTGLPSYLSGTTVPPHTDSAGIGLQTMRYRAHIINGVFDLRSGPRGGTTMTCTVRGYFPPHAAHPAPTRVPRPASEKSRRLKAKPSRST
jgi:two-component system, LuxR family, sensor kinase FixL